MVVSYINMQKLVFPSTDKTVTFKIEGIFGTPDDWKTTDDANPGLFTYTARWFKFEIQKGKIFPRELTAREQKQLQDKNKKGGKKDSKKEETGVDEQRLKKMQEEEERKRQQAWSNMTEEDKQYIGFQDIYKSPQLRFQNGTRSDKVAGKQFVVLQQRINEDHGEWIYVYKTPAVSEDELVKMRKTKPKTLSNVNDLNPIAMRAWVDLTTINSKETTTCKQRCKLVQVDRTPETSEPNLTNTYVKISITLQEPFITNEDGVLGQTLISDPPKAQEVSDSVKVVQQLRVELRLAIQSLAMEYSGMFWKDLNIYEDFKNMNYFINKKNDITKRKQHFLYDFNISGKYKILKDRIKKAIVHLCEKYFSEQMAGAKTFTGISCSIKDQFYSQIYNFLVAKYKQILQQLIFQKRQNLHEVQVLSPSAQAKSVQKMLNAFKQQTSYERITRIIGEYQILGNYQYGQELFRKYIEADPANVDIKYSYSMFSIRNKLKRAEEILPFVEDYLSYNKNDQKVRLEYLLLLIASQSQENCRKAWVLLREIIKETPRIVGNLLLASFIFSEYLNMPNVADRYLVLAERSHLRGVGKLPDYGKHRQSGIASELPTPKALPIYSQTLSSAEKDKLWIEVMNLFLNLNLVNVVQKIKTRIKQGNNSAFEVLRLKALLTENKMQEFDRVSKQLYQKTKSEQILQLIVETMLQKHDNETEKYLKIWLMRASGQRQPAIMLKLANYYLTNQHYGNARACVVKYLEKRPQNSGCSWRILGICELYSGNSSNALECLRKANLSDISNSENWLWLTKIYAQQGNFVMCNQCLNQYQSMTGKQVRSPLYKSISQDMRKVSVSTADAKLKSMIIERLEQQSS